MFNIGITREKLSENIRELVMKYSRTKTQKETGIPLRTLDNYLSGETEPKLSGALAIAKALGTTVEYLALREGPESFEFKDRGDNSAALSLFEKKPSDEGSFEFEKPKNSAAYEQYLEVLNKLSLQDIETQKLVRVHGDSMPPYKRGDLLVIDESNKLLVDGALYVFSYLNTQLIRQVQLVPGEGWLLKTNNPNYEDRILDINNNNDVEIEGRVIASTIFP
ncbi:MAG: LexA family transcriptional regulator [Oceanospirillaceae bacterium]|nr:LexA family transcriptional regulator [Oceanospirillaceae bacterium]